MLVACRLAGLSALDGHYAGLNGRTQYGPTQQRRSGRNANVTLDMALCLGSAGHEAGKAGEISQFGMGLLEPGRVVGGDFCAKRGPVCRAVSRTEAAQENRQSHRRG